MTIQEFAKSYYKLIAHQQDLLADMMGTMQDVYVPTESDIIKDLKNKDIDEIRENGDLVLRSDRYAGEQEEEDV